MRVVLVALCIIVVVVAGAQPRYRQASIPVSNIDGTPLPNAWAGGLNSAQFNTMKLNDDNQDDLVVFDRMSRKITTFIRSGNEFIHDPSFEYLFPEVQNWVLLRDYDGDGKKDLFTATTLGILVYRNTSTTSLSWQPFLFTADGGSKTTILLTKGFSGKINLQLVFDDIPAIEDADGDGDLDIFCMRFGSGNTIEYHKNFSKERYNSLDSLDFERLTNTYGGVRECRCGVFAFNNQTCPANSGGRTQHIGGKALMLSDVNADGVKDIILSEAECNRMFALINTGTLEAPVINSTSPFPATQPVALRWFPGGYLEDMNFDGKKDLIVSPGLFTKEDLAIDFKNSVLLYTNSGTDANPVYTQASTNFLQNTMIDVGDAAVPAIVDVDGDGKLDMLVSNNSGDEFPSTVAYFRNVGPRGSPEFELEDADYLGFGSSSFFNVKIQVVDVNGDGKRDLAFTGTNTLSFRTGLYYLPNKSLSGLDVGGQSVVTLDFNVNYSEHIHFTDVNADGKQDILAGRGSNRVEYWENTGGNEPVFTLTEPNFKNLEDLFTPDMAVSTADVDGDGKLDLLLETFQGRIGVIRDFRNNDQIDLDLVADDQSGVIPQRNLGGRLHPVAAPIFSTRLPGIIAGTSTGGVVLLKNSDETPLPERPSVQIFPNPIVRGSQVLTIASDGEVIVDIINIQGSAIRTNLMVRPSEPLSLAMTDVPAGIYLLRFRAGEHSFTRRLVIL